MIRSKRDLQDMGLLSLLSVCSFGAGIMVGVIIGVDAMSFLEKWQTLIGSFIALVAAIWTIWTIRKQIKSSEEGVQRQIETNVSIESDRLTRKSAAYRAILPSDLGSICEYSRECLASLKDAMRYVEFDMCVDGKNPTFVRPVLPEAVTKDVQNLIENASNLNTDTVQALVELLSCYQIQKARFGNILEKVSNMHMEERENVEERNFNSSLSTTIELYLRAEELFRFARSRSEAASLFAYNREMLNRHGLGGMRLENTFKRHQLDNVDFILRSGDWKMK